MRKASSVEGEQEARRTHAKKAGDNLAQKDRVLELDMEDAITFTWLNLGLNLLPGALLWVIQAVVRRHPPGPDPNSTYGYRTRRSMESPEAWAYANRRSMDLYAMYSWPLMAAAVPLTLYVDFDTAQMGMYAAFTLLCVWPLVVIERALKRGDHFQDPS